ncbi:MAG: hypothetical protein NZ482_08705 [Gloeomargarita sp. SKYG98]|nr:hypothetical protein [Gloeomargarita sp. SKYG98]
MNKGGRGHRNPYKTVVLRVPEPVVQQIRELEQEWLRTGQLPASAQVGESSMPVNRGGRGHKNPYPTVVVRVPEPLVGAIRGLAQAWVERTYPAEEPLAVPPVRGWECQMALEFLTEIRRGI